MSYPLKKTINQKTVINFNKKRDKKLKPFYEKFGEIKILPFGDTVPEAFLYELFHFPTLRWYVGMHGLKDNESVNDGAYLTSATDDKLKELLELEPENFRYSITNYGSMREMFKLENETLTARNAKNDPLSWNKWNGFVYEAPELPRLDLIEILADDAYDINSSLVREKIKVTDIYNDLVRLQVRFDTNLSTKKIREYTNEMKSNGNTEGFTLTIVRRDGKRVLVGGNHTLESALKSKLLYINVVFIDEDLTMDEMHSLGNALNKKREIQRMTTMMVDVASDLVGFYKSKKIVRSDFKDDYCTKYIKITGGFKGPDIAKVRRIAKEMIAEEESWKDGKKWKDWTTKTASKESREISDAEKTNSILCLVASGGEFRVDRLSNDWVRDADMRMKLGKKPRRTLKILMSFPTYKSLQEYTKEQKSKRHERSLMHHLVGYLIQENQYKVAAEELLINKPIVKFEHLDYWEDKIS
jgi:hypothetical protein